MARICVRACGRQQLSRLHPKCRCSLGGQQRLRRPPRHAYRCVSESADLYIALLSVSLCRQTGAHTERDMPPSESDMRGLGPAVLAVMPAMSMKGVSETRSGWKRPVRLCCLPTEAATRIVCCMMASRSPSSHSSPVRSIGARRTGARSWWQERAPLCCCSAWG